MKTFDHFKVGDIANLKHVITQQDVDKFVELTGDDNFIHVNKNFAKKTILKDTIAHGMLGASFVSTLIGKYIPGDGALWVSQQFDFLLPVRVGDELNIHARITEKHASQHILVLETHVTNQHKQTVISGSGKVKILQIDETIESPVINEDKKVVIVIGGSRGIGAATAKYLAKKNYRVVINYSKDREGAESVLAAIKQNDGEAIIHPADVRDPDAIDRLIEKTIRQYGAVSGLVYGATSKIIPVDFHLLEWQDIEQHLNLQLRGAFNCVQRILKEFINQKSGSVVFLGSIAADVAAPFHKVTGYATAKAALHTFAKSLALEYGALGIRFNIVSPGLTETALIAELPEKAKLLTKSQVPRKTFAKPEDICGAIEFLLSEEAQHITGETLRINGGQLMI